MKDEEVKDEAKVSDGNESTSEINTQDEDDKKQDDDMTETNAENNYSMEDFEDTLISIKTGQIVTGKILSVSDDELIVNVDYKSDGIIAKEDVLLEEGSDLPSTFEVGQEIKAVVTKINDSEGNVILSHRQLAETEAWNILKDAYDTEEELKGKCIEAVKGGVIATVEGLKALCQLSYFHTVYRKFRDRCGSRYEA